MTAARRDEILVDGDARDTVETHLDRNLFVEAGAGTGKTTVLVRRVVRLFATAHLPDPSGLVAITFTEAAAAQLRDRIRTELERAAGDPNRPALERERCLDAARRIDDAVITTLHGFAQRILAEHPLDAGLPPAFEVEEGIPAELAFAERWRSFVDNLFADPDLADDLRTAVTLGLPMERLREVARMFADRWDKVAAATFVDPGPTPAIDPGPVLVSLRAAVRRLGARRGSGDKLADVLETEVEAAIDAIAAAIDTDDELEVVRTLDDVKLPTPGGLGRREVWGDDKALVLADLEAAAASRHEQFDALRRHLLGRFLPLVADFTVQWARERAAAGRLHFHDLLVLARTILWRPDGEIRRQLAERYRVLLVDEFQDTDPIQVELVVALAAADPAAALPARWQDVELGHGRVLVVGDPKQSIYGFRGADVTLWNQVRSRFGDDVVRLSQNFRSVAAILDWVNRVFDTMMGDGTRSTQPPYVALAAARDDADDDLPGVAAFGGPGAPGMRAAEIRLDEATAVAAAIVELHTTRRIRYADVALLLPTRTPLGPIERALDEAEVPYRVESRSLVWETDVVRELLAVLTAIEDPADEVAVVAALRSPGFACRDDELVDFRRAGGRWDPTAEPPPPDLLPSDHPVVAGMAWLAEWHRRRWWVPVNELVAAIVEERKLVELCFAQRRPRDHWRRLRFVVDQARAFVEAEGRSLADFLGWAEMQTDEGAMAVETVVPEPDDDAVRILTVHGSKGLEFPVVLLAGLTAGRGASGTKVLYGDGGPEVWVSVPNRPGVAFTTAGFEDLAGSTKQADTDEAVRLLYVASTRARDHLLVSVHHKATGGANRTHAQQLYELAERFNVLRRDRVAGTVALPQALPLLFDDEAAEPPAVSVAERAERLGALEAVLARAEERWAVAPTAIHADDADPDDDSGPPDPVGGRTDEDEPGQARRRGATARGRAVHGVLEAVPLDGPGAIDAGVVRRLVERMAEAEGADADEVEARAWSALRSDALARARAAPRRWREVPVVAPIEGRVLEGYVDLLYEDPDGTLVVVDWKTDAARSASELDAALGRHRVQGAAYAGAIRAATGRTVSSVRFVFCRPDGAPADERAIDDLDAAVEEVRLALRR